MSKNEARVINDIQEIIKRNNHLEDLNNSLKEFCEDLFEEIKKSRELLEQANDMNKELIAKVKKLNADVFVLESHKELNSRANKRTEHYTKIIVEKDKEIETLKDEIKYLESKNIPKSYRITEEEWRV